MDLNKVMIIGNVTQDPELRTTPQGAQVTSFGVATNLVWTDASGMKQTKVEFHNIVAWRKLAEICSQYLRKGKKVYIEGRLQTRDWQDQNGVKRYRTEIIAENMIMLDRGPSGTVPSGAEGREKEGVPIGADMTPPSSIESTPGSGSDSEIRVEDIPF